MAIFGIKITETRVRTLYIDADYDFEALSKAELIYKPLDEDYIVDVDKEIDEEATY